MWNVILGPRGEDFMCAWAWPSVDGEPIICSSAFIFSSQK